MGLLVAFLSGLLLGAVLGKGRLREVRAQLRASEAQLASRHVADAEARAKVILHAAQEAATRMLEHGRAQLLESDRQARERLDDAKEEASSMRAEAIERLRLGTLPTEAPGPLTPS